MKQIVFLVVYMFIILPNFCMEQTEEAIYDKNYQDACGILQGTSENGLVDPKKILDVAAALADIRNVFSEKSFSKLRISNKFDRELLLNGYNKELKNALIILKAFPMIDPLKRNGNFISLCFNPEVDTLYLENLLKKLNIKAEASCLPKTIQIEKNKNDLNFRFKKSLEFGGTKKYLISYDPARQKITSYKRLKKCKN